MTPDSLENKRAHLQMIQAIVNRLSTNSFLLKGWTVVLVAGLFALSAKDRNPLFVYLAYLPACAFWGLDGYYLWQERLYRRLYDAVREKKADAIDFSMNTSIEGEVAPSWLGAVLSRTLLAFHGILIVTIVVVMAAIICSR